MDLTEEDIAHILRLVDETPFDEVEVEWKGLTVRASRRSGAARTAVAAAPSREAAAGARPAPAGVPEGCVPVDAPVMGTFYRRPEPGKPPFVEPGARVRKDDTLGLIEVMKVFTAVKAEADGVVEAVLAQDAQLVEYGQPLFALRAG